MRDADPHERGLTGTLDDDQIAEWRLNHGDELIVENLLQDIAYEDYLAEGDSIMALVNACLLKKETKGEETDAGILNAALREFFTGFSAQYPPRIAEGLASMLADIFPGDSIERASGLAQAQPICKEAGVFKYRLRAAAEGSQFEEKLPFYHNTHVPMHLKRQVREAVEDLFRRDIIERVHKVRDNI